MLTFFNLSLKKRGDQFLVLVSVLLAVVVLAPKALFAQGHSYVNYQRSSIVPHLFIQQSIEGEYGKFLSTMKPGDETTAGAPVTEKETWKGYGIGTSIGIELMKFIQFNAGHTFVNMRQKDDSLQRLSGSRLHAGGRLAFQAPVCNLELGAGFQGSRVDYQKQLENASLYGSGMYYSLGVNYFISTQVSFYFEMKAAREHMIQNGGSAQLDSVDTDTTLMGGGFRIWL